jgi:hypothetical protein
VIRPLFRFRSSKNVWVSWLTQYERPEMSVAPRRLVRLIMAVLYVMLHPEFFLELITRAAVDARRGV